MKEDAGSSETPLIQGGRCSPSSPRGVVCAWVILQKTSSDPSYYGTLPSHGVWKPQLKNIPPNLVFGVLLLNIDSEPTEGFAAKRKNVLSQRLRVGDVAFCSSRSSVSLSVHVKYVPTSEGSQEVIVLNKSAIEASCPFLLKK